MGDRNQNVVVETEDFTEGRYAEILHSAKEHYRFQSFGERQEEPSILWRHEIDFSVHRALSLAKIEADQGVTATYFVWLHCPYYNALEAEIATKLRAIADLGHNIGVHLDPMFLAHGTMTSENLENLAKSEI